MYYFNRKGKVGKDMHAVKLISLVVRGLKASHLMGFIFLVTGGEVC